MTEAIIAVVALLAGAAGAYLFFQRTLGATLAANSRAQLDELTTLREQNANLSAQFSRADEKAQSADVFRAERDAAVTELERARQEAAEVNASLRVALAAQEASEQAVKDLRESHAREMAQLRDSHREAQVRYEQQLNERLAESQAALKATFENVAGQVVQKAQEDFIKISGEKAHDDLEKRKVSIETMLEPITKELAEVKRVSQQIEKERHTSFAQLGEGIQSIQKETERLATALKKPQSRGAWGEMQLELTLANAGLIEGTDFLKQDSTTGEEGRLRSDFVINLTNGRKLVIDCKVPLTQYMEAMNATDEVAREQHASGHVAAVRGHVKDLSSKKYWSRYEGADCVVLFIPHEGAYNLAMERDPGLASDGEINRVYLAGPHSILAVVHLARYIMNQSRAEKEAQRILDIGATMVDRMAVVAEHLAKLGRNLGLAVGNYNDSIGSMERNLLTTGRDMQKIGVQAKKALPVLAEVETSTATFVKPELVKTELAMTQQPALPASLDL